MEATERLLAKFSNTQATKTLSQLVVLKFSNSCYISADYFDLWTLNTKLLDILEMMDICSEAQ